MSEINETNVNGWGISAADRKRYEGRAKWIAAVMIGYNLGITPQTAFKNYINCDPDKIGDFWILLVKDIEREMVQVQNNIYKERIKKERIKQ